MQCRKATATSPATRWSNGSRDDGAAVAPGAVAAIGDRKETWEELNNHEDVTEVEWDEDVRKVA